MNRNKLANLAHETVTALGAGYYTNSFGERISLRESVDDSVHHTRLIAPGQWRAIVRGALSIDTSRLPASLEVTAETALAAANRLVAQHGPEAVMALNFASARNPGGGFLNGARAQEESIARASGLYPTLLSAQEYYTQNRACRTALYTDYAILSPLVPVIREDGGMFLNAPWLLNILTMPAPNRGAIEHEADIAEISATFRRRIQYVLALAAEMRYTVLILGAWGCGAFRNDPDEIAAIFVDVLVGSEKWAHKFGHICFAIYDTSPEASIRTSFERHLGPYKRSQVP